MVPRKPVRPAGRGALLPVTKWSLMMKLITHKTYFMVLAALFLTLTAGSLTAEVYRIVDKDGNVTYTDQPPGDGSKPMDLKPISVVETPVYETPPKAATAEEGGELSLRDLRRMYRDFSIVAPQSEESIWHPDAPITVAWNTGKPLQDGMKVSISIDGKPQADTSDQIIPVGGLERGEHTVTAELKDSKNKNVATAEPVIFFVRRPNLYNNRARARPNG